MTRFRIVWAPLAVALALQVPATARADTASQVFDLWPGSDPGVPSFDAAVFDGRLCFRGRNDFAALDATGDELYCTDGTTVTLAADILPGATASFPGELTVYDGQLYFRAENPFGDNELWRWDGVDPPVRVFDLQPGSVGSFPFKLTVYDGQLYFSADEGSTGRELWRYDSAQPTVIGTNPMLVDDIRPGALSALTSGDPVVFDNILYFPANNSVNGEELFRFDSSQPIVSGTNPGLVLDLEPGPPGSNPRNLVVHDDGNLYFTALVAGARRLYRFDGANPPTNLSTTLDLPLGFNLVSYGGDLLFFALDDDPVTGTGNELWSYDGTTFTRVEPGVEYPGGAPFGEIDGFLYFIAGFDLFKYAGTGPPAPAVALFSTSGDDDYPIIGFEAFGGLLYFLAHTAAGGDELWALEAEGGAGPAGVVAIPTVSEWGLLLLAVGLALLARPRLRG
jgi:ELWxxDGT repeat protein